MPAPYTGRCACGSISVTIAGEPQAVRQCWCRQCQQSAAGSPTINAYVLTADTTLVGTPAAHRYTAASGNTLSQYFCVQCGTPIYGQSSARPHLMAIRLGLLDEGHALQPEAAIWTVDAPAWAVLDPKLEHFERGAPPPPEPG